ncbi:hypothetical protein CLOM_g24265 [Closterium sp. NIES-68]|nr:hypothetical protein CLOM_g24265 [Closterium sp. NIES-68]GJP84085.1 hypothetical protein CLOP_g14174 [Closterium sp. NIES-67]
MAATSLQCKLSLGSLVKADVPSLRQGPAVVSIPQRRVSVRAERLGNDYTGYVEKDTAGQENIYAVEPTIYVGNSGSSGVVLNVVGAAAALAGAVAVLFALGSSAPAPQEETYSGPPLSTYVRKFEAELAPAPVQAPAVVDEVVEAAPAAE